MQNSNHGNQQFVNQKAKVITNSIPGPKSIELRREEDHLIANGVQGLAVESGIVVHEGRGNLIEDIDGNQFLDIIGGIGVNGLGHSHPKFISEISSQVEKISVGSFTSQIRLELLKRIHRNRLSDELYKLQLYSSGSAAVESALRLAKNYSSKWEMVSFSGGFHGKTLGTLSLMGSNFKDSYGPFPPGVNIIPYANCYRCPFRTKYPQCGLACVEYGRNQLKSNILKGPAAFLVEPIQGTAGNIIPPKDFLPAVKELAREFGALLIVDEMITGFGRTGYFWGCELSGVVPDIITVGKQFGGGYPISGIITTEEISKTKPWGAPSGSSSSYGGNPLACAAANAAISIIEDMDLVTNSKMMGEYFLSKLKQFEDKYSFIGEVRGVGLLLAIEMVQDKKSKLPLSNKMSKRFFDAFLQKGLLTMAYNHKFRIQPAMIIDSGTIDNIVQIIESVFNFFENERNKGNWD